MFCFFVVWGGGGFDVGVPYWDHGWKLGNGLCRDQIHHLKHPNPLVTREGASSLQGYNPHCHLFITRPTLFAAFICVHTLNNRICLMYDFRSDCFQLQGTDIKLTSLILVLFYFCKFFTSYSSFYGFTTGNIKFHVALSNGVSAVGATYKTASVRTSSTDCSTWLTARREGQQQLLDGQSILNDINDLVRNFFPCIFG